VELARSTYAGCNFQHFSELLSEREGIDPSHSSVRLILLSAGIRSPKKRRAPKHRSRRERYPREGMLLQIDGSRDDWSEGRGPYLSLVGAIDDATGKPPYALFREQEDAQGYTLLLRRIVESYGIPQAFKNLSAHDMSLKKLLTFMSRETHPVSPLHSGAVKNGPSPATPSCLTGRLKKHQHPSPETGFRPPLRHTGRAR